MNGKLIPVFVLAALMSCSQPPVKEQGPRPVKLAEVTSLNLVEKSFSGVVSPDQFSDLAFKMSGPLISLKVDEGQKVRTGQVVAEIDPQDFKWEYEAKKASFQTAEAQLQRAKKLLSKQAISKQEYETTEASYSNAKAAFEYAQNQLEQTKLRAPFDGFIQKKYVENYQKVQAGQGIVCLINPNKLQIQYTMLHIESASFNEGAVLAPLSAIVASEENNDKFVFVYNAQSQKVERRQIEESGLVGKDNVIITKGLKAGDQVVSAGATRLVEGQQVKVLTD